MPLYKTDFYQPKKVKEKREKEERGVVLPYTPVIGGSIYATNDEEQYDNKLVGTKLARASTYTIPTSEYTNLPFESADYYDNYTFDLALDATKITCQKTGKYSVGVNLTFGVIPSGYCRADLMVNAGYVTSGITSQAVAFSAINYSEDMVLSKGDFVRVRIYQTTGSDLTSYSCNMYIRWLGV